jgi:mannan endo-1,4-beta-mannosidase
VCCALVVAAGVAEAGNVGIVRPQGDRFVVNGAPFYFVGTNAYYMITMSALGAPAYADDQLAVAQALGFTVMRVMGFANGPGTGMGGAALQPAPGVFNEASFRAFDYVLHKADLAGVRLLIPLTNGNPEFGGVPQYLQWCGGGSERAFYESPACKTLYKNYITFVLNRVNTYNGRRYKDDPTIFAWELANEPHIQHYGDPSGQVIRAWVAEIAAHIKAHDPNHMVATGEEGYDNTTAGYSPVSAYNNQNWLFDGNKGLAWTQNTADPNIDFGSIHLYPELWNLTGPQGNAWIADHIRIARSLGKPLVLGEFGMGQNAAATFSAWLQTWQAENGAGALVWQVMCGVCYGMRDQFGIAYPPGSPSTDVLASAAAQANARSVGSPPPPAPPPAPGPAPGPAPTPRGFTAGLVSVAKDYDGDGRADVGVYRMASGEWYIRRSSDAGLALVAWGGPTLGDVPVPADYDGDGRADIAVYRTTTGQWFIRRSSDTGLALVAWGAPTLGDVPVPAPYSAPGRADIAVYRPQTGEWFVRRASDGALVHVAWGASTHGDTPVPADFDGDGRVDIAVYRTSTGEWFLRRSGDAGLSLLAWGGPAHRDIPVPADYDGDGRADAAVYRDTTGEWLIWRSSDGGLSTFAWGAPVHGDSPVPGAFEAPGRANAAVYRTSTGEWLIRRSDGALILLGWGAPTLRDLPLR